MIRAGRLLLALLALMSIVVLMQWWGDSSRAVGADPIRGTALSIGLLLLGSWLFGRLFREIRLPKLSGYLVFGIIIGPDALALLPAAELPSLRLVETIAISLIALIAGGEIEVEFLKRSARLVASIVTLQLIGVFAAVATVVYLLAPWVGLADPDHPAGRIVASVIAGTIATAASPAVFIAVMNELHATGDNVRTSLAVMIAKDLALIVVFTIVVSIAGSAFATGAETDAPRVVSALALHLLGSLAGGVVFGVAFAWYMHAVRAHLGIFVVVGCVTIVAVSEALDLEPLIVALIAGVLMRNVWRERVGPFFHTMEDLSLPVYCVFFAVAGAKLDLGVLGRMWPAALAVVAVRAGAIWLTTDFGCRLAGHGPPLRRWLWTAFIPQAGVSVALIAIIATSFQDQAFAAPLYSLVLAVIAIHELVGPIVLRLGLVKLQEEDRSAGGGA